MSEVTHARKCILVIDDERGMRATIREVLQSLGHSVLEAANGIAGLEMATRHRPDLVIVDIVMPEKDGLETMKEIRDGGGGDQPRILAISGGGRAKATFFLDYAGQFGADATLSKPFSISELEEKVAELLR